MQIMARLRMFRKECVVLTCVIFILLMIKYKLGNLETRKLLQVSESTKLLQESEPAKLLQESEPTKLLQESESTKLLQESEPAKLLQESEPTKLLQESEPTKLLQESEPAKLLQESEPTKLLQESESRKVLQESASYNTTYIMNADYGGKTAPLEFDFTSSDIAEIVRSWRNHSGDMGWKIEDIMNIVSCG